MVINLVKVMMNNQKEWILFGKMKRYVFVHFIQCRLYESYIQTGLPVGFLHVQITVKSPKKWVSSKIKTKYWLIFKNTKMHGLITEYSFCCVQLANTRPWKIGNENHRFVSTNCVSKPMA